MPALTLRHPALTTLRTTVGITLARAGIRSPLQRLLLLGSGFAAGCLMVALAQVCQESVAQGDRWRAEQRVLANLGIPGR